MASIKISDLRPSDFDSFVDSESFLNDLSDSDFATINGGFFHLLAIFLIGACFGYELSQA